MHTVTSYSTELKVLKAFTPRDTSLWVYVGVFCCTLVTFSFPFSFPLPLSIIDCSLPFCYPLVISDCDLYFLHACDIVSPAQKGLLEQWELLHCMMSVYLFKLHCVCLSHFEMQVCDFDYYLLCKTFSPLSIFSDVLLIFSPVQPTYVITDNLNGRPFYWLKHSSRNLHCLKQLFAVNCCSKVMMWAMLCWSHY